MNIRSLNWPFWPFFNYQCLFCFGRFGDIRYTLSKEEHFEVLHESRLRKNIDTPGYHKFLDLLPRRKEVEIIDR